LKLANFEALIRGALAAKGAGSLEDRAIVYQSSRNALKRLIEENRSITVESAVLEQKQLEESILRIEAEFQTPPGPEQIADPEPAVEFEEQPLLHAQDVPQEASLTEANYPAEDVEVSQPDTPVNDPFFEIQQVLGVSSENLQDQHSVPETQHEPSEPTYQPELPQSAEPLNEPEVQEQLNTDFEEYPPEPPTEIYVDEPARIPSGFAKRRKSQRNWFWFIIFLVIIALLGWIGYRTFLGVIDGSLFGQNDGSGQSIEQKDEQSSYFSIVEPGDLTALVVSDRGRVEIVNEQGLEMIRILSVRNQADRAEAAKPILLRLKPGVIEQIRGKRVTAEIFARSGKSGPAQFSVECQFGSQIGCGRKRFRVGVQPEASIFAFTMEGTRDINSDAFIAMSTDITDNASITGEGDVLDIVYVRLRTSKNQ